MDKNTAQSRLCGCSPGPDLLHLRCACAAAAALSLCALAGKLLGVPLLAGGLRSSVPMAPSTACAFLLFAAALHPDLPYRGPRRLRLSLLLPVFLLAVYSLAICGADYLARGPAAVPYGAWDRLWTMSPLTAGLFLIFGASAAASLRCVPAKTCAAAAWGTALTAALSSVLLLGYLYGVPLFYGGSVIPVAATTAACFFLLSLSLLVETGRGLWPWNLFEGDSPRAWMMRAFIPLCAGGLLLITMVDSRLELSGRPLINAALILAGVLGVAWLVTRISARVGAGIEAAERRVLESEEQFRTLIEGAPEAIFLQSAGKLVYLNPAAVRLFGAPGDEALLGKEFSPFIAPEYHAAVRERIKALKETGQAAPLRELVYLRLDGARIPVESTAVPCRYKGQDANMVFARDISARKQAEKEREKLQAQFLQAQKMGAVGRLAGGVAHDFNNLLTAINGYAGFVLRDLADDDPKKADTLEILLAAERAAGLTMQLLAFSRSQVLMPQVMDLNAAVSGAVNLLKRIIGEDISLKTSLSASPCCIKADPGQIGQVLLNLAVNSRDAMPKGGTVTLETGSLTPGREFALQHPELSRGPLAYLSVRDTGYGLTEEVKAHLFEPFFTTKGAGKGTGLGLSTVYGVIKQSGGEIEVHSSPGQGADFRIYLPLVGPEEQAEPAAAGAVLTGNETILLVDDEDTLLRLGTRILEDGGYKVLTAHGGREALELLEKRGAPVDLLIADVVMPGRNGRELAKELAARKLAGRTLYISGYTDDAIVKHGVLEPGLAFLYKPFSPDALLRKLREVLDGPADKAKP